MPQTTFTGNVAIAGVRINYSITRDAPGVIGQQVTLDAATAGQLTTRTDNDTGTLTVSAGHGITNTTGGATLFWDGGLRRAMNTTLASNTTITLDGGSGDNLPVVNTNCTLGLQVTLNTDFPGNTVTMYGVSAQRRASVQFQTGAGSAVQSLDLGLSGEDSEGFFWSDDGPVTNPLNNDVGQIVVANGSSNANGNRVSIGVQYDSEE